MSEPLTCIPAPPLVPEDYVDGHKGYVEQAEFWRARTVRAEARVAELEEVILGVGDSIARLRIGEAAVLLAAAVTCPLCGARSEAECRGLEAGP